MDAVDIRAARRPFRAYIATGSDSRDHARDLAESLETELNISPTMRWWDIEANAKPELRHFIAVADLDAVRRADILIAILNPDGDSRQLGTHCEIGAALAYGVPVVLVSHALERAHFCMFYHHPGVVAVFGGTYAEPLLTFMRDFFA